MPDEPNSTAQPSGESRAPLPPSDNRLNRLLTNEERLWRGGLIAALIFLGFSILASSHHHRPPPFMGPMAMARGWGGPFNPAGPMMFASPYPPPWAMGGGCTCGPRDGAAYPRPPYPGPGPYGPPPMGPQGAPRG
jgi:hypothetical protein